LALYSLASLFKMMKKNFLTKKTMKEEEDYKIHFTADDDVREEEERVL